MNKKKEHRRNKNLIIEQSAFLKNIGIIWAIMGFLGSVALFFSLKIASIKEENIPILVIILPLLIWIIIILPYRAITTKKQLIIQGNKFVIQSNKKKYRINENLKNMIWWRKISAMTGGHSDIGNKIQIKFKHQIVMLNEIEFKNFFELQAFFEMNFKEKEKK